MSKVFRQGLLIILAATSPPGLVLADTDSNFKLSGFGTLGYSCFSADHADFVLNLQPKGPGRTDQCTTNLDSLLAVQVDVNINEQLEAGLQVTSDYNADRSHEPEFTMAQLRWAVTHNTMLRFGRNHNPAFIHSDTRNVRFAMPWTRPPLEVYGLSPVYIQDGIELLHEKNIGDWWMEMHFSITESNFENPRSNASGTDEVDVVDQYYAGLTLEKESMLLKATYGQGKVTTSSPLLDFVLASLTDQSLISDMALQDDMYQLATVGLQYQTPDWLFVVEYGYRQVENSFFRDMQGAYLTIGRHFDKWMPYVTVARRWTSGPEFDNRAIGPFENYLINDPQDGLLSASRFDTTSLSAGVSYQLFDSALIKLQADWLKPDDNSWGLYTNHNDQYNFSTPDDELLISLNFDFVF